MRRLACMTLRSCAPMLSPVARPSATSTPAPGRGRMCSIYRWSVLVTAASTPRSPTCTFWEALRAGRIVHPGLCR